MKQCLITIKNSCENYRVRYFMDLSKAKLKINAQPKFNHLVKFFGQIIWQIHFKILLLTT